MGVWPLWEVGHFSSASIVAAAISALLRHIGRAKVKIGVGGALIQFHPTYHALLEAQLNSLAPLNISVGDVALSQPPNRA